MDELDRNLLNDLADNSRISFAELGRKYNLTRVCIRERVNKMVEKGIIERYTIEVNPKKAGKKLDVFFDIEVLPSFLYMVAEELAKEDKVTAVFTLTGTSTIYMDVLLDDQDDLEYFLKDKLYGREGIINVKTKILLKKFECHNHDFF